MLTYVFPKVLLIHELRDSSWSGFVPDLTFDSIGHGRVIPAVVSGRQQSDRMSKLALALIQGLSLQFEIQNSSDNCQQLHTKEDEHVADKKGGKRKKKIETVFLVCEETGDYNYTIRKKTGTEKLKLKKFSPRLRKHTVHTEKKK